MWIQVGDSAMVRAQIGEAREAYRRAAEIDPMSAKAHTGLGRCFVASRRYRDAKVEFERAASLDSLDPEPFYRLGVAYAEAGETRLAEESLNRALARDPAHAPSMAGLRKVRAGRYQAAGLPSEYPDVSARPIVSRGELGVMLAIELGQDPDRPGWRAGANNSPDAPEARGAWGERWLRASIVKGWITPFPDGSYHFEDPVTRGALALLVGRIEREWPRAGDRSPDSTGAQGFVSEPEIDFPDLGPRHYLLHAAKTAIGLGLPLRSGGRFDPWASATGLETEITLRGLSRALGAQSLLPGEPAARRMVE